MAGRWSSEHVVAEYKDLQASAMAVDCTGQLALLAGRRAVTVVNLSQPSVNLKKIPRQSKWDISAAQWNPHQSHGNWFITACNTRADIWHWRESGGKEEGSLKAHTRVISDLDWCPIEPNTVATCSVDAFTYIWDIRDMKKPSITLQAVAGASQVKWNKLNSNLLATTHDGDLRIWDPRKGTTPVQYIAAHLSKIHGLDWCPSNEFQLATSSQDCSVKFWDITNPKQSEGKLPSSSPVWRARYTPFGKGLITVVVPQLRRGENSLFLWHLNDLRSHVHTFVGHTDVVLEFQWRIPSDECPDYQLVTWSKDQSLRLWGIEPNLLRACGAEMQDDTTDPDLSMDSSSISSYRTNGRSTTSGSKPPHESSEPVNIPSKTEDGGKQNSLMTPPKTSIGRREEVHSPNQPKTLQQEFTLVNFQIPNSDLNVQEMDAIKRSFTVSASSGQHSVQLTMMFPEMYPNNAPPGFQFGESTTIDKTNRTKLIKILSDLALQHVKHNRSCIEPCLRQLVTSVGNLGWDDEKRSPDSHYGMPVVSNSRQHPSFLPLFNFGVRQDQSVPFPRTSGARFCSSGLLICFGRKSEGTHHRRTSSTSDLTPRAMSALSAYTQSSRTPQGPQGPLRSLFGGMTARSPPPENTAASLNNYYNFKDNLAEPSAKRTQTLQKARARSKSRVRETVVDNKTKPGGGKKKAGPVVIYNTSCLLPHNKLLAETYVLNTSDVPAMCRANAKAAAAVGRKDLVQTWSLGALCSSSSLKPSGNPDHGAPWAVHPFGRKLLKSLLDHYIAIRDVQTLAMLCCAFGAKHNYDSSPSSPALSQCSEQIYTPTVSSESYFLASLLDGTLTSNGWSPSVSKMKRSNSWSQMCEDYKFMDQEIQDPIVLEKEIHEKNMSLLDPDMASQYDKYKKCYADILYQWNLLNKRAQVLKYVSSPMDGYKTIGFVCGKCQQSVDGASCSRCCVYIMQCAICHIKVTGSSSFCLACSHGGHSKHMMEWYQSHQVCPTGCGCVCLEEMGFSDEAT